MDPTTKFFSKLKKLAVTLESETVKLQQAFENRNKDGDSDDSGEWHTENQPCSARVHHNVKSHGYV